MSTLIINQQIVGIPAVCEEPAIDKTRFREKAIAGGKYILVVCLYGHFIERLRTRKEIEGYEQYLRSVADYAAKLNADNRLACVILCGGHTKEGYISEAKSVFDHFFAIHWQNERSLLAKIILEENSKNTAQNIRNALIICLRQNIKGKLIVICDIVRRLKVSVLAGFLINHFNKKENLKTEFELYTIKAFRRPDIHPHSRWWIQFLKALAYKFSPETIIKDLSK